MTKEGLKTLSNYIFAVINIRQSHASHPSFRPGPLVSASSKLKEHNLLGMNTPEYDQSLSLNFWLEEKHWLYANKLFKPTHCQESKAKGKSFVENKLPLTGSLLHYKVF